MGYSIRNWAGQFHAVCSAVLVLRCRHWDVAGAMAGSRCWLVAPCQELYPLEPLVKHTLHQNQGWWWEPKYLQLLQKCDSPFTCTSSPLAHDPPRNSAGREKPLCHRAHHAEGSCREESLLLEERNLDKELFTRVVKLYWLSPWSFIPLTTLCRHKY